MMFHRLGLINKDQRGFTLIEVIVAVAITGLITGGITMTIFQVFAGNARTSNHMTAVRQVQNAGYWISHDAQMAQSVIPGDGGEAVLTLAWVGWEWKEGQGANERQCINSYEVRYTYDGDSNKLWRHQKIVTNKYDGSELIETTVDESSTFIADYITPTPSITMNGNKLSVTIKAEVGEAEEERTYEITPRPST